MRLFIALPLPEEVVDYLLQLQKALPQARVLSSYHITLLFLGEYDLEEAKRRLEGLHIPLLHLTLSTLGTFPHVTWVGVHPQEDLTKLQAEIEKRFDVRTDWVPHITIARERIPHEQLVPIRQIAFSVPAVHIYESKLHPWGAEHVCVHILHSDTQRRQKS